MNNFERIESACLLKVGLKSISYIKAANPNNEIRPYQALSQDLKVAIYVMWDCSMLLFSEIPHWIRSFFFLNALTGSFLQLSFQLERCSPSRNTFLSFCLAFPRGVNIHTHIHFVFCLQIKIWNYNMLADSWANQERFGNLLQRETCHGFPPFCFLPFVFFFLLTSTCQWNYSAGECTEGVQKGEGIQKGGSRFCVHPD